VADPVNTGFDPLFGDPLRKFRAMLAAQGIDTNIISGVRDDETQRQLVANRDATLSGRPLPYPQRGPVNVAAPVGSSTHEFGLGADVQPGNPADAARMHALAQQFGLAMPNWGGHDPYHVQLANWQQAKASQAQPTPWSQVADIPSSFAMNAEGAGASQPGRPVSATPIPGGGSHADYIRAYAQSIGLDPNLALGIANAEGLRAWSAKNPNAASGIDVQAGQPFSFGDFQLNVRNGLGTEALKGGIDPRDPSQWQAADRFALDRMKAGGVGPWKGDAFAKQYLATGNVPALPAMPGTTLNSAPPAVAGGPGAPAAAGQPGQAPGASGGFAGSPAGKSLAAAAKTFAGDQGGADEQAPRAPPPMQLSAQASGGPMMMGPGGQNTRGAIAAQQALAQAGFMMQPSLAGYGGGPRPLPPTMPIGQTTGMPGLPGTTLNSPSQLQMALMTGQLSPYDLYGQAGFGGGYGSS
jgi:hypothetical protein